MELTEAKSLISQAIIRNAVPQRWADLGSGSGLFSVALASLLEVHSSIHCIDSDEKALQSMPPLSHVTVLKQVADFVTLFPSEVLFDGILMANSLHFIEQKAAFLSSLKSSLIDGGRLVIVEYDLEKASRWVPFPLSFIKLQSLAIECGFRQVIFLHEMPSRYDNQMIYAAMLQP